MIAVCSGLLQRTEQVLSVKLQSDLIRCRQGWDLEHCFRKVEDWRESKDFIKSRRAGKIQWGVVRRSLSGCDRRVQGFLGITLNARQSATGSV